MHYYLTAWRTTPTGGFMPDLWPVTADGVYPTYTVIDLRPDPTVTAGWAVVATGAQVTGAPSSSTYLGDGMFAALPSNLRNRLRNNLGLSTLAGLTVPEIVVELLTVHGTTDGSRWRPLQASTRTGRRRVRFAEVSWEG